MTAKTSETARMVDQFAKTAHEMVDRVHELAVKMEQGIDLRARESSDRVVGQLERQTRTLEDYIEANPAVATAIAFGLGVFATRFLKTGEPAPAGTAGKSPGRQARTKAVRKAAPKAIRKKAPAPKAAPKTKASKAA